MCRMQNPAAMQLNVERYHVPLQFTIGIATPGFLPCRTVYDV